MGLFSFRRHPRGLRSVSSSPFSSSKRASIVPDDSSYHKGDSWRRRRRLRILVLVLVLAALLAIALGVGLGVGLKKKREEEEDQPNRPHTQPVTFPTDGLDLSPASLKTRGSFYTSSDETDAAAPVLAWTAGGFTFKNYSNDTTKADIVLNTSFPQQLIDGFGAAMTDSAAYTLFQLKQDNMSIYNATLTALFNPRTGIPIIRIPLGCSDFSLNEYVFAPNPPPGDVLAQAIAGRNVSNSILNAGLGLNGAQTYIIPVMRDILALRPSLKVMYSPWSPPAWMKTSGSLAGGSIIDGFVNIVAMYYVLSIKAFVDAGVPAWSMTLQNEPSFAAKYPSMVVDSATQSQLASAIRALLPTYNLTGLKIFAHDNNWQAWQDAADIVNLNASAIDGIAWHAYKGDASQIDQFRANISIFSLETHMTEFTGTADKGKTRWDSQQYWIENVYFPMLSQYARSVEIWNIALDPKYGPRLRSSYCNNCVGALQISSPQAFADPWVQVQPQYVTMAHFDAATVDLTPYGGGPAYRALTVQQTNSTETGSTANMTCITSQGFVAPLKGTDFVPSNVSKTNTVFTRRIGLVLYNACNETQSLGLNVDGRATTFDTRPGLTSLVWEAP